MGGRARGVKGNAEVRKRDWWKKDSLFAPSQGRLIFGVIIIVIKPLSMKKTMMMTKQEKQWRLRRATS